FYSTMSWCLRLHYRAMLTRNVKKIRPQKYLNNYNGIRTQLSIINEPQEMPILRLGGVRTFMGWYRRKKTDAEVQLKDDVPRRYECIYQGKSIGYVRWTHGSVVLGIGTLIPLIVLDAIGMPNFNIAALLMESPIEATIFLTFSMFLASAISRQTYMYPYRIYYCHDDNNFLAVMQGLNPLSTRQLILECGQVEKRINSSITEDIIPWAKDCYTTPTQNMILYIDCFRYPMYFNKLLGFQ
ncbi:unnamed protein product, partial [Meganyctiphanes norvegica]